MRAAVLNEEGQLELRELPSPTRRPEEMLLRTRSCGLCGSDLYKIRNKTVPPGAVLGHEIIASVEEGPSAITSALPLGTRITVSNHIPCGRCFACLRGRISACRHFRATQVDPGGFAELIRVPATHIPGGLIRVPDGLPDATALMAEPLGCCLRALERWEPGAGDWILVVGLGVVGLLMVLLIQWAGAVPVGVDPLKERRRVALEKGCREAVAPEGLEPFREFQGVILTACNAEAVEMALRVVQPGGWIGLFAGPSEDVSVPCRLQSLYRKELDLIPSYSTGPEHMAKAMDLLAHNTVDVSGLITHHLPIDEIQHAVVLAQRMDGLKSILYF